MRFVLSRLSSVAVLAFALLAATESFAIPESNFDRQYSEQVTPFVLAQGHFGEFAGEREIPIRYVYFPQSPSKGSIVISEGYTENYQKYFEMAYDLYQRGYSVFLFDHRGQGNSGRLLNDTKKAYIDRFKFFVLDMKTFVNQIVKPNTPPTSPLFLLGNSMGGAIAARYLEKNPKDFKAAVLSTPMFAVNLGSWSPFTAKLFLTLLQLIGRGQNYAYSLEPVDPTTVTFEKNLVTHSRARYNEAYAAVREKPELSLFGPTNSWVLRSVIAGERAAENASRIEVPVLVLQAEEEAYVINSAQSEVCKKISKCEFVQFARARHELFMEEDQIRDAAISKAVSFFGGIIK